MNTDKDCLKQRFSRAGIRASESGVKQGEAQPEFSPRHLYCNSRSCSQAAENFWAGNLTAETRRAQSGKPATAGARTFLSARWPKAAERTGMSALLCRLEFMRSLRTTSTIAVQRKAAGEGFPLCTAIDEIARSLRRNFASFRFPIGPFPSIRICFGFRASDFGFPAPPGCALRVSAVKWAARKESPPTKELRASPADFGWRISGSAGLRLCLWASLR